MQAVRAIVARDGIRRGMFAGYGAFLLRDLPFDAIEFWAFDTLNMRLKEAVKRELNPVEHGVCGAIAGAVTGASTPGRTPPTSSPLTLAPMHADVPHHVADISPAPASTVCRIAVCSTLMNGHSRACMQSRAGS